MPIGAVVVLWAWATALPGLTGQAPCRHGFPSSAKWLPEEHILPEADVVRARTARPHDSSPVLAPAHASVSSTINAWLEAHLPLQNLANCQDFTLLELDALVLDLAAASSAELDEMYLQKGDRRALRHDNASGYAREWELQQHLLNRLPPVRCQCHLCRPMSSAADCCCLPRPWQVARASALHHMRDGKCFEAVNLFHHQLSAVAKEAALEAKVRIPLLPSEAAAYDLHHRTTMLPTGAVDTTARRRRAQSTLVTGAHNQVYDRSNPAYAITQRINERAEAERDQAPSNLKFRMEDQQMIYQEQSPCMMCHKYWVGNNEVTIHDVVEEGGFPYHQVMDPGFGENVVDGEPPCTHVQTSTLSICSAPCPQERSWTSASPRPSKRRSIQPTTPPSLAPSPPRCWMLFLTRAFRGRGTWIATRRRYARAATSTTVFTPLSATTPFRARGCTWLSLPESPTPRAPLPRRPSSPSPSRT